MERLVRWQKNELKVITVTAGMLSALDESVGKVFWALRQKLILEDTIVVFTSDNGGAAGGFDQGVGSNWPLRGSKATLWEGGVRAVGFVWNAKIVKGRVAHQLMHVTDWLPTLYSAAGMLHSQKIFMTMWSS